MIKSWHSFFILKRNFIKKTTLLKRHIEFNFFTNLFNERNNEKTKERDYRP